MPDSRVPGVRPATAGAAAAGIACSRLYLDAQWITDVLGGAVGALRWVVGGVAWFQRTKLRGDVVMRIFSDRPAVSPLNEVLMGTFVVVVVFCAVGLTLMVWWRSHQRWRMKRVRT